MTAPPSRARGRHVAACLLVVAACAGRSTPAEPPAPARAEPALAEATCASCHREEASEWRESMHHASFTSPDFQRSFAMEPRGYCVGCHAPLGADREAREAGIGCTACHEATADHARPSRASADRAAVPTRGCETCHDFAVPGTPTMLQATAEEHRASAFAATACEVCHMPGAAGRRSHRFDVTRNRDLLSRAIRVGDVRVEGARASVTVTSVGVGHRFPTGDLFRRLVVTVSAYDANDALVGAGTFTLCRDVDGHRASVRARRRESDDGDTRLDGTPRELAVECGHPPSRVHVTVEYERGSGGSGDAFDSFARLALFDADVAVQR